MTLELKNSELEAYLLTLSSYEKETNRLLGGLLSENLTLGTKRKLQKIHKGIHEKFKEFTESVKELNESCKTGENDKKEPIYDMEKLDKEAKILLEETVKIEIEPVQLSLIEEISSSINYNFDIIEKFAI